MKKKYIWLSIVVSLITVLILGYLVLDFRAKFDPEQVMLNKVGLQNLSIKDRINKLDSILDEPANFNATITPEILTLTLDDQSFEYALPEDEFYVSFAPYVTSVHPCQIHNLVGCRGELLNETFNILIVDQNGKQLINQEMKSMDSGFIGLWLPRNIEATLTITYQDLSVTHVLSTNLDSDTCITTPLQLS